MENTQTGRYKKKAPTRGGARKGAGRPKGSSTKLSAKEILDTAESMLGKPFIVSVMEGYIDTIKSGDTRERVVYEKFILDKTASNHVEAEVTNTTDSLESKRAAFAEALKKLTGE